MPTTTRPPARHAAVVLGASLVAVLVLGLGGTAPGVVRAADPPATPTPTPRATPPPGRPTTPIATIAPVVTPSPTPAPTTSPTPSGITKLGDSVTFYGRGYGHGVGMSQYGAKGRAVAGQTADQILAHYYQGATRGTVPLDTPIRVRILQAFKATTGTPLVLSGLGGSWTIDGIATTFPAKARVTVTPTSSSGTTTWKVKVTDSAGKVLRDAATTGFRMRPAVAATLLQVVSKPSSFDTYRGVVRVRLDTTAPTLNVINELPLEDYLRGVVPAEMPASWPTQALRAQSIAARSYAACRLRPGVSYYDVNDDTSSQVYHGREGEAASTDTAIKATAGAVLMSGSAIANALFHSAGGGATEDNENVFVSATGKQVAGPVGYLRGSPDRRPDGTAYDDTSPYATWRTKTYTRAQLSTWFGSDSRTAVGSLTALDLRDRGVSGRLISVTLIGSAGTRKVSGDVFRSVFNAGRPAADPSMRSSLVDTRFVP
jgi:SpoIID/LytB domain protein